MAKLAITVFAVLLLVANAYAHRTTITTIEIDEDAMWQNKVKCQQQIEETDLSHCERYITQSRGQQERAMVSAGSLQQCCGQMQRLHNKCMCKALKQIVEEGQEQGGSTEGQEQKQTMTERAQTVVIYCRLPQRCQWGSAWF